MGTVGYMAPEMLVMLSQPRAQARGYTKAVDWWSLGATIFKLLVGVKPFDHIAADFNFVPSEDSKKRAESLGWVLASSNPHIMAVLSPLQFPGNSLSPAMMHFIYHRLLRSCICASSSCHL